MTTTICIVLGSALLVGIGFTLASYHSLKNVVEPKDEPTINNEGE